MARQVRTITIGALNIAMHRPHSAERYVELFRAAYSDQRIINQGEVHGLMLGSLHGLGDALVAQEFTGEVYRCVKVDASEPWFDIRTRAQATPEEVGQISIPPHLLAHFKKFPFVFYPDDHELVFVSKDRTDSLAIPIAEKFFQQILSSAAETHGFPQVDVTVVPDRDALEEVLSTPRLHRLEISYKRPNPDDSGESLEARYENRLARLGASSHQENFTAAKGEVLVPDEQLKAEAAVAARNGNVKAIGQDAAGAPIEVSTSQKPARLFRKVNEAIESVWDVLRRAEWP